MYFPYFRGRQYELLALKELAQGGLIGKSVVPVVEPVKLSSTFNGTMQTYSEMNLPIALILNPAVGELSDGIAISPLLSVVSRSIIPAVILNKGTSATMSELLTQGGAEGDVLAIITNRDYLDVYMSEFANIHPRYTLFPDERQIRRFVHQGKVMLIDKFNKQDKNADYLKQEDEFYSDDHLYFAEEGYSGFGDYSVIGEEYVDGGFAPYAVAIHIVYFADDNTLRVRHFVSDSNNDISDVAGKFHEAVLKLRRWFSDGQREQLTEALGILIKHAENGYYPGLPTIKKLSIMHHLELMGKYLDGGLPK